MCRAHCTAQLIRAHKTVLCGCPRLEMWYAVEQERLRVDTHAAIALQGHLGKKRLAIFVDGDGNCLFRSMAVCLWKSEYFYAHLKLFVLAHAVKNLATLSAEGSFLRDETFSTCWEPSLLKLYASSMGSPEPCGNYAADCLTSNCNEYGKLLLAQIAYHCRDRRRAGKMVAYLACEALGMPVKLLAPQDVVTYAEALKNGHGTEASLYVDNRSSGVYLPRGEKRVWCVHGASEDKDFSPVEIAVVMTEYKPEAARYIEDIDVDRDSGCRQDVGSLNINPHETVHFAAILHHGALANRPGPPFPIRVAAPSLNAARVRHPTSLP